MSTLTFGKRLNGFVDRKGNHMTVLPVTNAGSFNAFLYKCPLNVDWDGAPDAYGLDRAGIPAQTGLDPRESPARGTGGLGDARTGGDWSQAWCGIHSVTRTEAIRILRQNGLIPPANPKTPGALDAKSQDLLKRFWDNRTTIGHGHSLEDLAGNGKFPIVQIPEMTSTIKAGFYVSTTSWHDDSKELWDPHRYLDASTIPYSVIPALHGVAQGDFGLVIRNQTGDCTPYVCGDSSASSKGSHTLGECSGAVYLALKRENEGDFTFIVFPGSRGDGDLTNTAAAEAAVRVRLAKLTSEDADDLANHSASTMGARFHVRWALAQWGAPPVIPDAISGAGAIVRGTAATP